jgi:electron transfer flavoprotein beta subunit
VKILIFIKEAVDVRVHVEFDEHTGRLKPEWNVPQQNPHDRSAIEIALKLKKAYPETSIGLVHLGPPAGEELIRTGLARGCDVGIRLWDEEIPTELLPAAKAFIFARVAKILGFDVILTGSGSDDSGDEQVGILLASDLKLPCIPSVVDLELEREKEIVAMKRLSLGFHQRIRSILPSVVTVEALGGREDYPALPLVFDALEREVTVLNLAELGITKSAIDRINGVLTVGPLSPPKPKLKHVPAPDSSLPAFERIGKLVEGTLKPREGRIVSMDEEDLVTEIFETFVREGWLDHLRRD